MEIISVIIGLDVFSANKFRDILTHMYAGLCECWIATRRRSTSMRRTSPWKEWRGRLGMVSHAVNSWTSPWMIFEFLKKGANWSNPGDGWWDDSLISLPNPTTWAKSFTTSLKLSRGPWNVKIDKGLKGTNGNQFRDRIGSNAIAALHQMGRIWIWCSPSP